MLDAISSAAKQQLQEPATLEQTAAFASPPDLGEVVLLFDDNRLSLMIGGEMKASAVPFLGSRVRQVFNGTTSPTRVPTGDIAFEIFIMGNVRPEDAVSLAIPDIKRGDRRVETMRTTGFFVVSSSSGEKNLVSLRYEKMDQAAVPSLSAIKHRVKPEHPLVPGEYVLVANNQFFDFGVNEGPSGR